MVGVGVVKATYAWLNHTSKQAPLPEMSISIIILLCSQGSCSLGMLKGLQRTVKGKYKPHKEKTNSLPRGECALRCCVCQAEILTNWEEHWGSTSHKRAGAPGKKSGCHNQRNFLFSIMLSQTFLTGLSFDKVVFIVVPSFEALKGTQQ